MKKQRGFSIIEITLVVATICIIAVIGYIGFTHFLMPKPSQLTQEAKKLDPTVVKIEKSQDLDKADKDLDSLPLEDDSSFLDSTDF